MDDIINESNFFDGIALVFSGLVAGISFLNAYEYNRVLRASNTINSANRAMATANILTGMGGPTMTANGLVTTNQLGATTGVTNPLLTGATGLPILGGTTASTTVATNAITNSITNNAAFLFTISFIIGIIAIAIFIMTIYRMITYHRFEIETKKNFDIVEVPIVPTVSVRANPTEA